MSLRQENDPDAETKLLLRVGVKVRPDTPIDHTKVKIQVFFYDMVNNDQVVLTNAEVSYEWVTPGHDWRDTGNEVLEVTYLRPKRNDPAPGSSLASQPMEVPDSVEKANLAARKPAATAELPPTSEMARASISATSSGFITRTSSRRCGPIRLDCSISSHHLRLFPHSDAPARCPSGPGDGADSSRNGVRK